MPEQTADHTSIDSSLETTSLAEQMDRLSLEQALRDFEIANLRVLDLTQRLITATNEINSLRHQLESLRIEHSGLVAREEELSRSRVYKLARMVSDLRRVLRF